VAAVFADLSLVNDVSMGHLREDAATETVDNFLHGSLVVTSATGEVTESLDGWGLLMGRHATYPMREYRP